MKDLQYNQASVIRLGLASAEDIRQLAVAEVALGETVRPGTNRPVPRGLFCEQIFGREQDWECRCGKLRGAGLAGRTCANCGNRVVHLRSTRFGYLELISPVVHPLFFRPLARILNYSRSAFQRILAFMDHVVVDAGDTPLRVGQLLTEEEMRRCRDESGTDFQVAMGGEAIRLLLDRVNLLNLGRQLREQLATEVNQEPRSRRQRRHLLRRLHVVDTICRAAPDDPDGWAKRMLLDCLPILPPGQRPLPQQRGQPWENINHLYARLIEANGRLGRLFDLNAPVIIIRNDQRMVQLLVTAVLNHRPHVRPRMDEDEDQEPPPEAWLYRERHSSLAARLRCDIRHRLLNKRVDYSARAVLVPDPSLRLEECGLPWCIAIELFRPLVLTWLAEHGGDAIACRARQLLDLLKPHAQAEKDQAFVAGMRLYRELLQGQRSEVEEALQDVMRGRWILLSRGPIASPGYLPALQPRLIDGAAVSVHPLLGRVLQVDFSGEVVTLHLPLSDQCQEEASRLLNPALAVFRSVSGEGQMSLSAEELCEEPATENGREGLRPGEYFRVAQANRRRLLHEKQRRQEADDLRRVLVAVGQGVVVTMHDCGTTAGVEISGGSPEDSDARSLAQVAVGRVSTTDIVHPETRKLLVGANEVISAAAVKELPPQGVFPVQVRSPLTCTASAGICQRCYGVDHATGRLIGMGRSVGLLAALALAESAAHLQPRTFLLGRCVCESPNANLDRLLNAGGTHYTSSLSRLRELLEATTPPQSVPLARCLVDATGDQVERGEPLRRGAISLREILRVCGIAIAKQYLLHELRCVCRVQRIEIDDRHLELIVSRMFRHVTVKCAGDTDLVPGRIMERAEFRQVNEQLRGVVIVEEIGDSRLPVGRRLDRAIFERECVRLAEAELRLPTCRDARPARARPRLQGISEISKSEGLLSALRLHEPVEALANRALAGRADEPGDRPVISSPG